MQSAPFTDTPLELVDELVLELAELERARWREVSAGIPAWHPRLEGDDDDDADDDDEDDDDDTEGKAGGKRRGKASGGDDDDEDSDAAGKRKRKAGGSDDDDDDEDSELARARKAAARVKRENRALKRQRDEEAEQAKKDAGKFKDLYEETKGKLDALEAKVERRERERLVEAALGRLKVRNAARAVKLLGDDLDDVDDEADADRIARALKRTDGYLFEDRPTRQRRDAGKGRTDDADDDDRDDDDDDRGRGNGRGRKRKKADWGAPVS